MKSLREQFEEDYAAVPYTARPGGKMKIRYVYDAPWYRWDLPEAILKKKKWILAGMSVAGLGIFILTALLPAGLNIWYCTAIAGTCSLAAHILELFGVLRFMVAKYKVTRIDYNYINGIMKIVPWIHGGCLVAAFITGVVYQVRSSLELWNLAAAAGYLICAGISFYIAIAYKKIPSALS